MVKYGIHTSFPEEFGDQVKVHDRHGPKVAVRLEFEVPVEKLDRFNEPVQRRSRVKFFGGPE
ncbi:hypothetical protein [Streptomyces sp. NPDC051704]|uniref:hypothetical protein n=1 Tax=Streptomyces sp. NPDC051704 TaxID=3365671 RepID=UPI0037A8C9BD